MIERAFFRAVAMTNTRRAPSKTSPTAKRLF